MHMYLNLKKACRGEASQMYQALKTTFLLRMNCMLPLPEVLCHLFGDRQILVGS